MPKGISKLLSSQESSLQSHGGIQNSAYVGGARLQMQRKYYTKVKGISPLLATVLLVAATVATTTMLSGWMSSTTSATQNTIANRTTEGVACAAAEIVIDDVYSGAGSGGVSAEFTKSPKC